MVSVYRGEGSYGAIEAFRQGQEYVVELGGVLDGRDSLDLVCRQAVRQQGWCGRQRGLQQQIQLYSACLSGKDPKHAVYKVPAAADPIALCLPLGAKHKAC